MEEMGERRKKNGFLLFSVNFRTQSRKKIGKNSGDEIQKKTLILN